MNIQNLIREYMKLGYNFADARSKVCQDIILLKISNSKFKKNITVKGGVVIHNISEDLRRATRDLDLDFIKYSLEDDAIIEFINILNHSIAEIKLEIVGDIRPLHHQDYDGKRVFIKITDEYGFNIESKLDIGVHKLFDLEQDEYCFSFDLLQKSANVLINSKEQIFTEKLKSLLKLGGSSTRYKDIFDFYYLINIAKLDRERLLKCFRIIIFDDVNMRENSVEDIIKRLNKILNSKIYRSKLNNPKINWLNVSADEAISDVLDYLEKLILVSI